MQPQVYLGDSIDIAIPETRAVSEWNGLPATRARITCADGGVATPLCMATPASGPRCYNLLHSSQLAAGGGGQGPGRGITGKQHPFIHICVDV